MLAHTLARAALAAVLLTAPAAAGDAPPRTIRVTGEGKATAVPDLATIQAGVVTQAATAEKALAANSKAMRQLLDALKAFGIAAKDVQTSRFDIHPIYKHDDKGRRLPEIASYRVTNQARVRVRKLGQLGEVLDAVVAAGGNQVTGIDLSLDDPTVALDKARARAVADARRRANLYAEAAGVRVGKVLTIREQTAALPPPRPLDVAAFAKEAGGAVPIATGEEELRARIDMTFALEDAPQR